MPKNYLSWKLHPRRSEDDDGCRAESSLQKLISPRPSIFVYGDRSNKLIFFSFHPKTTIYISPDCSRASSSVERNKTWFMNIPLVMQRSNEDVLKFGTQIDPALHCHKHHDSLLGNSGRHSNRISWPALNDVLRFANNYVKVV